MKKKWIELAIISLAIVIVCVIMTYSFSKNATAAKYADQSLMMIAKDSPGPNCDVYIYAFRDGTGGYYLFAVTSRNFKDGVAITQLK